MKLFRTSSTLFFIAVLFASVPVIAQYNGRSANVDSYGSAPALSRGTEAQGALPEVTEAERMQKLEADLQAKFGEITRAIEMLEMRAGQFKKQVEAPSPDELKRFGDDINIAENQLAKMNTLATTPLSQLRWSDLQERIFQLRVQLEIMSRRWGLAVEVFGLNFFQSAPPVLTPNMQAVPTDYRVRIGDELGITILSELGARDEYASIVDINGGMVIPGVGRFQALGKTTGEVRDALESTISLRFKQLRIQVVIRKPAAIQVQVAGEVARPGTYTLGGLATVFNALYQAGGPTKSGTFRNINVVRGGTRKLSVDLYDFLISGSKGQDIPLEDGDMVFVPPVGKTITVGGEVVRPGRYEPDFPANLSHVLKLAGGAKSSGYLQTLQVERVVKSQYTVLLDVPVTEAEGHKSFVVEPGDQITVLSVKPDRNNQVTVSGPVASPGMYGLRENMKISDLVQLARGLAPDKECYMGRGDVLRIDPETGYEILAFNLEKALKDDARHNIELKRYDQVFIYEPDQVVFRPKLVTLAGSVARSGTYKRTTGMRVSDLVAAAGGVLPDAYLARADLNRRADDDSKTLIRIDLRKAMNGDPEADLVLEDRDEVTIYSFKEAMWQSRTVRIEGAVQRPGEYVRSENMRVSDLIFASGGLLPEAKGIVEVAKASAQGQSNLKQIDLAGLMQNTEGDVVLGDGDIVTVPAINPHLRNPEVVFISGEVANPGPYALHSRSERLADVIARAGGLTYYADVNGLLFLRQKESFENGQQERDVDVILKKSQMFADKQFLTQLAKMGVKLPDTFMGAGKTDELAKPVDVVADKNLENAVGVSQNAGCELSEGAIDGEISQEATLRMMKKDSEAPMQPSAMGLPVVTKPNIEDIVEQADFASVENSSRVSINLAEALANPVSANNIMLRNGDRLFIPRVTNIVTVVGAVLHPHSFAAGYGKNADYYIERSGGYAQEAARNHVVVVRSNGDALPKGKVKTVEPGDMIVVPSNGLIDVTRKWEKVNDVTKALSDVLSSVYILTRF